MLGISGCLHSMAEIFKGSEDCPKLFFADPNLCYNVLITACKNLPIVILLMLEMLEWETKSVYSLFDAW